MRNRAALHRLVPLFAAGAVLACAVLPAGAHEGQDDRPGAARMDLEVLITPPINGETSPGGTTVTPGNASTEIRCSAAARRSRRCRSWANALTSSLRWMCVAAVLGLITSRSAISSWVSPSASRSRTSFSRCVSDSSLRRI